MTIEERLVKMEIKVKRNNRILLAAVLLAAVLLALGATTPGAGSREDTVEAKRFILLDDNGKIRATLDMFEDGPMLGLFDENGRLRIGLGVRKDRPKITLLDENGEMLWKAPP